MEFKDQYPLCDCGQDHHFFTCACGCHSFHISAVKKFICSECNNVFDVSNVLAMIKNMEH